MEPTYEYIDMYSGMVELLEEGEVEAARVYGYMCSDIKKCTHSKDDPNPFWETLTCRPGAYRMDATFSGMDPRCYSERVDAGVPYAGSNMVGPANTHLIVGFPGNDLVTSNYEVFYIDVSSDSVGSAANMTAAKEFCNAQGGRIATIDELKILYWELFRENDLDIIRDTDAYKSTGQVIGLVSRTSSGVMCLSLGVPNSSVSMTAANNLMQSTGDVCATGNKAVICVFSDTFVK